MNLNVLSPKKAVQSALDRPDIPMSVLVVVLPSVAAVLGMLLFSFPLNAVAFVVGILKALASWVVLGLLVYLLLYFMRGREMTGRFPAVLSAVSLVWVVSLLATVLGIVFVSLAFDSSILSTIRMAVGGALSPEETGSQIAAIVAANPNGINFGIALVGFGVGVLLMFLVFYLIYSVFSDMLVKSRILPKFVLAVAAFVVWLNLFGWIAAI